MQFMLWFDFTEDGTERIVNMMGMKEGMLLCEAYVKQCRAKNELEILEREMKAFTEYYEHKETELMHAMSERRSALAKLQQSTGSASPSSPVSQTSVPNSATGEEASSCSHRYVVSEATRQQNAAFIKGEYAVLSKSLVYVVRPQLYMARQKIESILGNSMQDI